MKCDISLTEITSDNEFIGLVVGHDESQIIKIATGRPTPKAPPIMNRKSESQSALSSRPDMPSLHHQNGHEQAAELNEANTKKFEQAETSRLSELLIEEAERYWLTSS